MSLLRMFQAACALALFGNLVAAAAAAAAAAASAGPQPIAELTLQRQATQPKWFSDGKPLFGDYLASGDGSGSGILVGKIASDLYEETETAERHPAFFRGFLERDGRRYPFEIIGLYTPESPDRRQWRITGAITFTDNQMLGMKQASLTGTFQAGTNMAHYTIWGQQDSR